MGVRLGGVTFKSGGKAVEVVTKGGPLRVIAWLCFQPKSFLFPDSPVYENHGTQLPATMTFTMPSLQQQIDSPRTRGLE